MVGDCLVGPVIKALWYFVPSAAPRTDGIFLWPTAHGRNEIPPIRCYDFAVIKVPRGQGKIGESIAVLDPMQMLH